MRSLRTSELARAVGIHPNTARRYVARGILPPVEYSPAGYRRFTAYHLACLRLARQVYRPLYAGRALFLSGAGIVQAAAGGDLAGAGDLARRHLALVVFVSVGAEYVAVLLDGRSTASATQAWTQPLHIGEAARTLGVTIDMLRNWDRNGLIEVPRDPANGYRCYGAQELERLSLIRMLSCAGYRTSAILRVLLQLDRGEQTDLRRALDSPAPTRTPPWPSICSGRLR
jgi:DNA-binding transcriptional MerR regulator